MENFLLLLLTDEEDAEGIYTIFSPNVREETENLQEKITELIYFFNESMLSWEFNTYITEKRAIGGENVIKR